MAARIDDRWLWLGTSIAFVAVAHAIRYALEDIISLTELEPKEDELQEYPSKQPEDSISVETLRTLAASPNPSIKNAVTSLVVSRFMRLPNSSYFLNLDAHSPHPELQRKAKTAETFLKDWDMPAARGSPFPFHNDNDDQGHLSSFEVLDSQDVVLPVLDDSALDLATILGPQTRSEPRQDVSAEDLVLDRHGRHPDAGLENQRRRDMRARREAMVLHEGGGGIVAGDIIHPRVHSPR